MIAGARKAGTGLMKRFASRGSLRITVKGTADFVSQADLESEETLRSVLLGAYPRHGLLAEESAATASTSDSRFIVDPLDGTTNFLHGVPHFAVAIALEREGVVVAGLVFDPAAGELFVAERGKGAWLGRERLRVSTERDLGRALIGTGIPHAGSRVRHSDYLAALARVMKRAAGIRRLSAAALDLSYVASGRFDAFFEMGLKPWDIAAGILLVEEAGGSVTEPAGGARLLETGDVLATNGPLQAPMRRLVGPSLRASPSRPRRTPPRP